MAITGDGSSKEDASTEESDDSRRMKEFGRIGDAVAKKFDFSTTTKARFSKELEHATESSQRMGLETHGNESRKVEGPKHDEHVWRCAEESHHIASISRARCEPIRGCDCNAYQTREPSPGAKLPPLQWTTSQDALHARGFFVFAHDVDVRVRQSRTREVSQEKG